MIIPKQTKLELSGDKMDFQNLQELALLACTVGETIADAQNGLAVELPHVLELVKRAPAALKDANKAWDEYLDLDDAEKAQLKAKIQDDFDIADDKIEATIELCFGVLVDLSDLAAVFFKPVVPPAPPVQP